jgi:hypothetical protein
MRTVLNMAPEAFGRQNDPLISAFSVNGFLDGFAGVLGKVAEIGQFAFAELDRGVPANWDELTIPAIERVCQKMDRTGCNLAWVPRPALVERVLSTLPSTSAFEVLLEDRADVAADLRAAVAAIDTPALEFRVKAATEAVDSFVENRMIAAQAAASVTLTGVAHDLARAHRLDGVRRALSEIDLDEATILDLRRRAVRRLVGNAMRGANRAAEGPYSRSASAHDAAPGQYTEANALAALLLLVGALCELREELLTPELAAARRWSMGLPIK